MIPPFGVRGKGGSTPNGEGLLRNPSPGGIAFTPLTRGDRGVGFPASLDTALAGLLGMRVFFVFLTLSSRRRRRIEGRPSLDGLGASRRFSLDTVRKRAYSG